MDQISGFELKIEMLAFGTRLEFPGAAIHFRFGGGRCGADASLSPDRIAKLKREMAVLEDANETFLAQTRRC